MPGLEQRKGIVVDALRAGGEDRIDTPAQRLFDHDGWRKQSPAPKTTAPHLAMRGRWTGVRPMSGGVADGIQNGDLSC